MRRRPVIFVLIAVVEALAPLWTWLQLALFNGLSPIDARAVLAKASLHAVAIALAGGAAGVGLLRYRRWGYGATVFFCTAAAANDALLMAFEPRGPPARLGLMTAASLGALGVLSRPKIRALFRNPRLRWWKAQRRYRTQVAALVEVPDAPPIAGEVIDVSADGAFIAAAAAPRTGARCAVVLRTRRGEVRSGGEVAWVSRGIGRHPQGFGSASPARRARSAANCGVSGGRARGRWRGEVGPARRPACEESSREEPLRILYHHRTLGDGAEGIHIRAVVDAWRESGHEVEVAALIGPENDPNAPSAAAERWARVKRRIPRALYEWCEIGYNAVGLTRILRAGRRFRPGLIYGRYVAFDASAVIAARLLGVPVVVEANAPLAFERARYETLRHPRLARWFERRILSAADLVVAVSTPLRRHFERTGVPAAKIRVLPNGADPRRFRPEIDGTEVRRQHGLEGAVVVGFSGSLRDWHGVDLLLEAVARAAARAPALKALIVGDGPLREDLEREARDPRLAGRVAFAGRVAHDAMPAHLAAMDVPVSPRATFYASPMKVLEYMAMGRATVAPRMGNLEDLIEDGRDGLLFLPESVDDLAGALTRLALDGGLRRDLGRAAREKVVRERSWGACAAKVLEWVGELPGRERRLLAPAAG